MTEVVANDVSEDGAYLWARVAPRGRPHIGDKVIIDLRCFSELNHLEISMKAVGTVERADPLTKGRYGFAVKFEKNLQGAD